MKRITSTLLLAALPALGLSTSLSFGPVDASASQQGRRGGSQEKPKGDPQGEEDEDEEDKNPPPAGIDPDSRAGYDIYGRKTKVRADTFNERIKGGWQLQRLVIPGSSSTGRVAQGFMNIGESFMSFELHALWQAESSGSVPENDVHTTFTAEYKVDGSGKMLCTTIIGSYIDEQTGELRWERAGYEREYRVIEGRDGLELNYTDPIAGQGKMTFRAFVPRTLGTKDIFGRNELGSFGTTDIYGRKKASQQAERDIYGRPVEGPKPEEAEDGKRPLPRPPKGPGAGGEPLSGRGGR